MANAPTGYTSSISAEVYHVDRKDVRGVEEAVLAMSKTSSTVFKAEHASLGKRVREVYLMSTTDISTPLTVVCSGDTLTAEQMVALCSAGDLGVAAGTVSIGGVAYYMLPYVPSKFGECDVTSSSAITLVIVALMTLGGN